VLLPSNQSTIGSSSSFVLNDSDSQMLSMSGASSCDSSNSFSFRTLQPGQYSGPLDYCASSPSSSGRVISSASRRGTRTDEQILEDLRATRHRRQRQEESSSGSSLLDRLRRAVASALRAGRPCGVPPKKQQQRDDDDEPAVTMAARIGGGPITNSNGLNGHASADDGDARVQWARGKAGEDRVHVVVSEERGWMFVGIYDGFNGPDATDYLVANLYASVCRELVIDDNDLPDDDPRSPAARRRHGEVLDALARALRRTEDEYFAEAEARAAQCPELAMMGSCVLVVLMKGSHVYSMNVGDSRAVLAHRPEPDLTSVVLPPRQRHDQNGGSDDLAGVTEEIKRQFDECDLTELVALQLTMEHSTSAYKVLDRSPLLHLCIRT
jgi:pyruvate dehydrogenase phosphatase